MRKTSVGEPIGPVACRSCDLFQICAAIETLPASSGLPRCPTLRVVEIGETLYAAGDPAHHIYALRKGMVKSECSAPDGTKRIVALHVPGEVVGEEGIRAGRYINTVIALTPAMVCELPFRSIANCDSESLQLGLAALTEPKHALALRRPRRAQHRLDNFARDLVARLQSHGVAPRELALGIARYELADLLGISIDSLRRALQQGSGHNAITVKGKHLVVTA
jgi:CRP/FNR family transcriptional regulator